MSVFVELVRREDPPSLPYLVKKQLRFCLGSGVMSSLGACRFRPPLQDSPSCRRQDTLGSLPPAALTAPPAPRLDLSCLEQLLQRPGFLTARSPRLPALMLAPQCV